MALRDRILEYLRAVPEEEHRRAVQRAWEAGYDDGGEDEPPSGDLAKFGYRRATAGSIRDFGGLDYGAVQDTAWRVFLMSPVAKRYLHVKRDYELGGGVVPASDSDQLTDYLQAFWADNKLDSRAKKFALQLHLLGEQMYPVFVRATDGRVRLGYIDPVEIEKVITHPDNVLEKWIVVLKPAEADSDEPWRERTERQRLYRIVRVDEGAADGNRVEPGQHPGKLVTNEQATIEDWERQVWEHYGVDGYEGACFYFSRNDLSNQARGYTDLLQVADWIDQDEMVLFDLADRENAAGYFFGDVTLTGANEDEVKKRSAQIAQSPPKKGSYRVHNENEQWNLNAPDLKQQPSIETHRELNTFTLGGLGLPRHWYGYGDETNRATAQAQNDPTWRTMEQDQDGVRDMFVALLAFARDQAEIAGPVDWDEGTDVDLTMPEMTVRDMAALSTASSTLATALMIAVDQGWLSRETAAKVFARVVEEMGVEVDVQEELKQAQVATDGAALGGQTDRNSWLQAHGVAVADEEPTPITFGAE